MGYSQYQEENNISPVTLSNMQRYQKEETDFVGGVRNVLGSYKVPKHVVFNEYELTLEDVIKRIEGNAKDLREYIETQKKKVYDMASNYQYVRDHSVEIENIKHDVSQREIELKAYEHCLRIARGEQMI